MRRIGHGTRSGEAAPAVKKFQRIQAAFSFPDDEDYSQAREAYAEYFGKL
jgi:hypothetical protein